MKAALIGVLVLAGLVLAGPPAVAHDGAHCGARVAGPTPPYDMDCDSVRDETDNCPPRWLNDFAMRNPDQRDSDADGLGDKCDPDDDDDGVLDGPDNCDTVANPPPQPGGPQADSDGDGIGDACAFDRDNDGAVDPRDNCAPKFDTDTGAANPDQRDTDADGYGDHCDSDDDDDYVLDVADNCPLVYNQEQTDLDGDGIGHDCDPGDAAPAPPPSPSPQPDVAAPTVKLTVARTMRLRELGGSIPVQVRCSESCSVRAQLTASKRKLASGTAALGGSGTTYVFLRKLRKLAPATATLKLTATDAAGNRRTVTRRILLRR